MARQFSDRLGMREYEISEEEFLNPGALVDSLLDDGISETGGFIARLQTWTPEYGQINVCQVKHFINQDSSLDFFHPEWLTRTSLVYRCVFDVNPVHAQTVGGSSKHLLRRRQLAMKRSVNDCAFLTDDSGELSTVLKSDTVFHCSDIVLDNLENLQNEVVYVQNMCVSPPLDTCPGASMTLMKTGLEKLSNQPLLGINKPTVYVGTELSTFPCHREDMAFCAMNRHIAGAPKVWFCVPPRFYEAFLWLLRNIPIPEEQKMTVCQLLHKNLWIDPRMVVASGIPVYTIVQRPGDIVYLLPNTIHWGFNVNYNMNEAVNFVCRAWVLPGMLSHQRCKCKAEWYCRFEIRDVLVALEAEAEDLKQWTSGATLPLVQKLKALHPNLYTRLRDVYDLELDEELMQIGIAQAKQVPLGHPPPQSEDVAVVYPKCTRCDYCPKRSRSDAFDRIEAHAKRCHGADLGPEIMEEVRKKYQEENQQKVYKCSGNVCPKCGKTIRGNWSNVLDHQGRRNCKKNQEHEDDADSPSTSGGDGGPTKRRKASKK